MKEYRAQVKPRIEGEAWLRVENPDLSMEEAVKKARELGNEIIEVDYENRRIKIMEETFNSKLVYKCDYCPAFSRSLEVVEEHERQAHP